MSVVETSGKDTARTAPGLPRAVAVAVVALVLGGTATGLAGVDLVLPAVPGLPEQLGGSPGQAQLVLSAYVLGTAVGLLCCGALSAVMRARWILVGALSVLAAVSLVCSLMPSLTALVVLRFFQGVASAAPAVLAPGLLRRLLPPAAAVRALGVLSSVESLVPALAPLAGAGLVAGLGWTGPFLALAVAAALVAVGAFVLRRSVPDPPAGPKTGGYLALLRNRAYLRQAGSQALTMSGLLVFVFGAPAVIEHSLGGTIADFIFLQVVGVAAFIVAANLSGTMVRRWGAPRVVFAGTALAALGGAGLLVFAVLGGHQPVLLIPLLLPVNIGLGLRGPAGFMAALDAAGDDARGAAVIVLLHTVLAATGNAVVAAFLDGALVTLTVVSAVLLASALVVLGRPAPAGQR
ncbi:MFS transporter [Streptoalloteichus hindustanus]|uniref:Predicted arabinose efflux permease, MFS family n=1 Tax=Streptoalloteichus hindustanus TaxID=2017 RepID=A0A1M5FJN1_STRHI|nr:MFS transporter [Streptoalloteichus hindustanus]SHF91733.1 Predicted arabinose efflux permease, MFS family [Streptoalloteichus hindustanus]